MKLMKKLVFIISCITALLALPVNQVFANANYPSYTYDEWDTSAGAPDSYTARYSRTGMELDCGNFKEPQDIFISQKGEIYIADTGNNRLVVLDEKLNLIEIMDTITKDGVQEPVTDPKGLYIAEDGSIYIAQTSLGRVIKVVDKTVVETIENPTHALIGEDFSFQPTKIGVDTYGRVYVLSKGCYSGLLQFDTDGKFMDFYGANKVEVTAQVLFQYMWKNLLSEAQREAMTSILPIEYSNIDCADDGFIYTTTVGTKSSSNQIKKLNPLGKNTYFAVGKKEVNFGDEELAYIKGSPKQASFVDLKVDEQGFIFGLDMTYGRIFERDQEGNLIAVFGGIGKQLGTFSTASALDVYQGNVYVLDSLKANITMFEPTEYENLVRQATVYYTEGMYEESAQVWEQVRKRNSNNTLAYIGKGRALTQTGEYKQAMKELKAGGERVSYSKAFAKNRLEVIRAYAPYAVVVGILLILIIRISKIRNKKRKGGKIKE